MKVRAIPSPIRLLKERYFGEEARNPWVAKSRLAKLSERLPPATADIARAAVDALIAYQDPNYALLYLDRIERFVGPGNVTPDLLAEIARLLAVRMQFDDPIWFAQLKLAEAGGTGAEPDSDLPETTEIFRLDEIVAILPASVAQTAVNALERVRLSRKKISIRFSAATRFSLLRLKALAALRNARTYSLRFAKETALVERWLHMIERSQHRQPAAVKAIIESAGLISGRGEAYRRGLASWNFIVDNLVKPACYSASPCPDLADTIARAQIAAAEDFSGERLRQIVAGCTLAGSTARPAQNQQTPINN